MQLNKKELAFAAAWIISAVGTVYPQRVTDHLHRLVERSARRLAIAEQIALAKWDSGRPVEDAYREAEVIASAVKMGESRGLDQATASNFFRAQVEANKLVQYSLLAEWRRLGKAPDHAPVDLAGTIRPELDQLGTKVTAEFMETRFLHNTSASPR